MGGIFTLGCLIHDFLTDRRSSILGVWAAPGGKPSKKVKGEATHLFGRFPGRPEPPKPPKIDDFRSVKKS